MVDTRGKNGWIAGWVDAKNALKNKSTWVHTAALHAILSVKFQKQNINFFLFFLSYFVKEK